MMAEVERLRAQVDLAKKCLTEKAHELRMRGMECFDTVGLSTHVKCEREYCEACHINVTARLHMRIMQMMPSVSEELKWRTTLRHVQKQVDIVQGERRANFLLDLDALESFETVEVEAPVNKRRRTEVEVTMAAAQQQAQPQVNPLLMTIRNMQWKQLSYQQVKQIKEYIHNKRKGLVATKSWPSTISPVEVQNSCRP